MFSVLSYTILPIFSIILLGRVLEAKKIILPSFTRPANQIVFYLALPAMLFNATSRTSFRTNFDLNAMISMAAAPVLLVAVGVVLMRALKVPVESRSTFLQCGFHGNIGFMSYAVVYYALGSACSISGLSLPRPLVQGLEVLSGMALPMGLLLIGAILSFGACRSMLKEIIGMGLLKFACLPLIGYGLMLLLDVPEGLMLPGIILLAAPPATITYVMATELGGDPRQIDNGLANADVQSVAADPGDPNILYAGSSPNYGMAKPVYKSTDGGANWFASDSGIPSTASISAIYIDPVDHDVLYAREGQKALYRSTNKGETRHPPANYRALSMVRITQEHAARKLMFPHKAAWRKSAVRGRRASPFISTEGEGENRVIKLHQDGQGGRTLKRSASNLPRTVLSVANAAESPTALLARREMQSWRLLQLEPSSLREPDGFTAPAKLGMDGSHLAATLYHLARGGNGMDVTSANRSKRESSESESPIYGQIASRLSELIDDIYAVCVDRDEKREILTLRVTDRGQTSHPARGLSDGTLRFLALAVLELDPESKGLLCLEEPENGIHPQRIPAMLRLLEDIAVDTKMPLGIDNPLRQIIINTHSPTVVAQAPDDSLLVAELKEDIRLGRRFKKVCFSCLSDTWRAKVPGEPCIVSRGKLLFYLNPVGPEEPENKTGISLTAPKKSDLAVLKRRRVVDRDDLRQLTIPLAKRTAE